MKTSFILSGLILAIIITVYFLGKNQCEQENIIKTQEEEIITKEVIINQTKRVNERRTKALAATPDANLVWLSENLCQDCR